MKKMTSKALLVTALLFYTLFLIGIATRPPAPEPRIFTVDSTALDPKLIGAEPHAFDLSITVAPKTVDRSCYRRERI